MTDSSTATSDSDSDDDRSRSDDAHPVVALGGLDVESRRLIDTRLGRWMETRGKHPRKAIVTELLEEVSALPGGPKSTPKLEKVRLNALPPRTSQSAHSRFSLYEPT